MKKIVLVVLSVLMILTFCSCGKSKAETEELYNMSVELFNDGKYEEALNGFLEIEKYSDSSSYIDSCTNIIKAKENFEGSWCWVKDSSIMDSSNDVYMHAYNPYDKYVIDFDRQVITLEFNSSSTEYTDFRKFTVLSSETLVCDGFRDENGEKLYWYFIDGEIKVVREQSGEMYMRKVSAEN